MGNASWLSRPPTQIGFSGNNSNRVFPRTTSMSKISISQIYTRKEAEFLPGKRQRSHSKSGVVYKPLQISKQIAKQEDIRAHTRSQRKQAECKKISRRSQIQCQQSRFRSICWAFTESSPSHCPHQPNVQE